MIKAEIQSVLLLSVLLLSVFNNNSVTNKRDLDKETEIRMKRFPLHILQILRHCGEMCAHNRCIHFANIFFFLVHAWTVLQHLSFDLQLNGLSLVSSALRVWE